MIKVKIFTLLLFLVYGILAPGQTSQTIIIGPNYSNSALKLDNLYIYDGIPISRQKQINRLIKNLTTIDTVIFQKGPILDCSLKPNYSATFAFQTIDSINPGLKHILSRTDNWILTHPLAELIINERKTSWNKAIKRTMRNLQPSMIENIELFEPSLDDSFCNNGIMKLTIKR
jgi:hypothetical protein